MSISKDPAGSGACGPGGGRRCTKCAHALWYLIILQFGTQSAPPRDPQKWPFLVILHYKTLRKPNRGPEKKPGARKKTGARKGKNQGKKPSIDASNDQVSRPSDAFPATNTSIDVDKKVHISFVIFLSKKI